MNHPVPIPHDKASQDEADAREFDDYARTQDPVQLQAALWATRRTEGMDTAREAQFQQWLTAAPAHGEAYAQMLDSFDRTPELPLDTVQALKAGLYKALEPAKRPAAGPAAAAHPARTRRPVPQGRRAWILDMGRLLPQAATAATVVAMVGGGWMGWDHWRSQPLFEKSYTTERGQQLKVDLPDGSRLHLDAATQAEVRLYRGHREVRLLGGQAMFAVHANPEQVFYVLAGEIRVTVVGTRFSVRHSETGIDAGKTVVAVESGRVRVERAALAAPSVQPQLGAAGHPVELVAGQGITADETGAVQSVINLAPGSVASWRNGRINFNDTPLAQALAEFERYGNTGLVVRDPAIGMLRLGGSFDLRHVHTFAQALPQLLPVRLERRDGVTEIVSRR